MPLWKDIEAKAAKLGITVGQGRPWNKFVLIECSRISRRTAFMNLDIGTWCPYDMEQLLRFKTSLRFLKPILPYSLTLHRCPPQDEKGSEIRY